MKRIQAIELFANIRATFVSFFSIFMFVVLGGAVFLGISWSAPALQNAADAMFSEGAFHHFQIQFPYGLTNEDLDKLSEVEGVNEIEAERQSFQTIKKGKKRYAAKVQSLGQSIDTPIVVEGTLPTKPNEMAFHNETARQLDIKVGDTVTFAHDSKESDDGMQYLTSDTYTVTAIIESADYIGKASELYGYSNTPSGKVDALVWLPDEAFDAAAYQDGYPIVNMRCDGLLDLGTYTKDYEEASSAIEARISVLGEELSRARFESLHGDAQAQLDEAERQMADAKKQIADGEKKIQEGESELEKGREELKKAVADGEKKLADGLAELEAGEQAKAQAEAELASARSLLDAARSGINQVDSLKADVTSVADEMSAYKKEQDRALAAGEITQLQHDDNLDAHGATMGGKLNPLSERTGMTIPVVDHTNYGEAVSSLYAAADSVDDVQFSINGETMTIGQARSKITQYEKQVSDAQAELDEKSAELAAGWQKYNAGKEELETKKAEGEKKIADGEAELESAKQQLQAAKDEVAKNEPKLEEARKQVAALTKIDWTVLSRAYNAGAAEVSTFAGVADNLSISMAALFIIVGLLVSYFAMNRLVHEQITQIGTKKALGFHTGEITLGYLLYADIAVLAGVIVGALIAYFVVEAIIGGVFGGMFAFGAYPAHFDLMYFLIIMLLELALVLGATYLACRGILKQEAVDLLRDEAPSRGKVRFYEKWAVWEKLPLLLKVIVSNCVNDKRRMLSTIVGVAGSTALIVTAITLNNDVLKSYDRHYEDVYGFNTIAYVKDSVKSSATEVEKALEDSGATATSVVARRFLMEQPDGKSGAMRIVAPVDVEDFAQVYHIKPTMGETVDLSAEGAWVSQAYGTHLGAKVGDVIVLDGGDGTKHKIPILGFYEFWLSYHEMVMGPEYYQKEFGTLAPNAVFAQTKGDLGNISKELKGIKGYDAIVDDAANQHITFDTFSSVSSAVVAIYLVLAALMAIVVLLNLNTMFIDEKKRELIVLRINGFSVRDAKNYVSYDSIVLNALGILAGIILGCVMGAITVAAIEPATGVFVKDADMMAMFIGIIGSSILSFVMGTFALRRVPRLKLSDINRL